MLLFKFYEAIVKNNFVRQIYPASCKLNVNIDDYISNVHSMIKICLLSTFPKEKKNKENRRAYFRYPSIFFALISAWNILWYLSLSSRESFVGVAHFVPPGRAKYPIRSPTPPIARAAAIAKMTLYRLPLLGELISWISIDRQLNRGRTRKQLLWCFTFWLVCSQKHCIQLSMTSLSNNLSVWFADFNWSSISVEEIQQKHIFFHLRL